ncbi:hypothetical protein [Tenacibaculum sp. MAR_2010_89]|uniref:hypothetical protein n=1 Tax=Tenacibaculum sp. MAR_2010_89 TaxID=1250198 RepID=UPI000B81A74B|nr:hypothetical protein [Tenacibaculum sp. MAR_2010_89]
MENSYEQLNIEFIETRKASLFTKLVSITLSLTLVVIPLVEILPELLICDCIELLPPGSCVFGGNGCTH